MPSVSTVEFPVTSPLRVLSRRKHARDVGDWIGLPAMMEWIALPVTYQGPDVKCRSCGQPNWDAVLLRGLAAGYYPSTAAFAPVVSLTANVRRAMLIAMIMAPTRNVF